MSGACAHVHKQYEGYLYMCNICMLVYIFVNSANSNIFVFVMTLRSILIVYKRHN